MNLLFSCVGRRGYLVDWFREHLEPGSRIFGTGNTEWTPAFQACDRAVLLPGVDAPAYLPALLELCRSERIDALLSCYDLDVDLIARHRERFLDCGTTPVVSDARVSTISLDKCETARFLRDHGFRTPETLASLDDALTAMEGGGLRYPVMVKPRFGFASRHLFVARCEAELRTFFAYAPDMIVQESLAGEEHSLDVLNDLEGRVISVVAKRKVMMRAGETDQAETVLDPHLIDLGVRLGRALAHVGPLDVDIFVHGADLTILEMNARFGGAYPTSHLAGADFPRKILDLLRGRPVPPDIGAYKGGVRMMKDYRILRSYDGELADLRGPGVEPRS